MNIPTLLYLSFIPPVFLAVDMLFVFLKRRKFIGAEPPPRLQIWIQDFLFLALGFVAAMLLRFERSYWTSAIIPILSTGFGFLAAVEICSSHKRLSPLGRALIFSGFMAGFAVGMPAAFSLWFIGKRISAWRTGRACADWTSAVFASAATLPYAIAFLLPMGKRTHDDWGFDAYWECFCDAFYFRSVEPAELPVFDLAGMANPCFWIAIAFLLEGRRALAATMALVAVMLTGGPFGIVKNLNYPAYCVWFCSMVLLCLLALASTFRSVREKLN